ncbi:MAG: hypothetical protein OXT67_11575, partial [Zetaproteobacteria bacterium]|nr:hypothetical protein [Zetaproteobacteria bacterium]
YSSGKIIQVGKATGLNLDPRMYVVPPLETFQKSEKVLDSAKKIGIKGKDLSSVTKEVDYLAKGKVADIYEAVAKNKPLGLGSTGRGTPNNLKEQAAMLVTKADPQQGKHLSGINMTDTRWPGSQGWQKWQATHKTSDGKTITIHYVRNKNTDKVDDFKFVD